MSELAELSTEQRNPRSMDLDLMEPLQVAQLMNDEDRRVVDAVEKVLPQVAKAIAFATASLRSGGRIIYLGAGTSGRLGVLDAAECPPTFGVSPDVVVGLIAGGEKALFKAVEGAEDSTTEAQRDLEALGLASRDTVIGLAASGRTPYVIFGLRYARSIGCKTAAIACTAHSAIGEEADVAIEPVTGPEVLTGSTRLKAGTAQKMILNMISTGSMVGWGKAYENLMVDVQPTNEKLRERARRIVMEATGCTYERATQALGDANGETKTAIVALLLDMSSEDARQALNRTQGRIRDVLGNERGDWRG